MVLQKSYNYTDTYPQVVARAEDLRAPRSFLIDATKVSSYAGADGVTQKLVAPGAFGAFSAASPSGKIRVLPRTLLTEALTASSTTAFNVSTHTARHFIAADPLVIIPPYAIFTVTGTWAANDTGTITVAGRGAVFTAANATLADIAVLGAAAVNTDPILKQIVRAAALGAAIYVWAWDMRTNYAIATADTAAGSLPITGSATTLGGAGTAVGTVSTIDADADEITLSTASAVTLPIGFPVGVLAASPSDLNGVGYGMLSTKNPIDLQWGTDDIWGAYISGTFYRERLPYWDGELANLFPEIHFQ